MYSTLENSTTHNTILEGQSESVVLTCPKVDLAEKVSIAKCCPEGKMRKSDNMGENTICASNERSWQIPINGHLYNSTELWNKKKLVYDNRSLVSLYRYDFKFMTHEIIHFEIF